MKCPTCRATVWFDTDLLGRSLEVCNCGPKRMTPPQRVPVVPLSVRLPLFIIYGSRVCPACAREFSLQGRRQDTLYCSARCRVNLWKRRAREETALSTLLRISVRCSA